MPVTMLALGTVVLLDRSASRLYLAESGLVPPAGGTGLPNHHTPMHAVPGERSLAAGQNELKVAFESDPVGGVKLVKTYTFHRGDYVIDVQHQIVNDTAAAIALAIPRLRQRGYDVVSLERHLGLDRLDVVAVAELVALIASCRNAWAAAF